MAQGLKSGVDRNNMDFNVKPGENFYEYAAGNWLKSHPLDKEHPMNGAFVDLEELNKKRIREMVEDYAKKPQTKGTVAQKMLLSTTFTWIVYAATVRDIPLLSLYWLRLGLLRIVRNSSN